MIRDAGDRLIVAPFEHDAAVTHIAHTRFPFAGQTTWPADYVTITNVPTPTRAVDGPDGPYYPDIVIVDGGGRSREIGEVELLPDAGRIPYWRAAEAAADNDTPTHVKHLFFYVPVGLEAHMTALLDKEGISYAGVRGFTAASGDASIEIIPFVTRGDLYDHQ